MKFSYVILAGAAVALGAAMREDVFDGGDEWSYGARYPSVGGEALVQQRKNREFIEAIGAGTSVDEVVSALGQASFSQRLGDYRFLMYRTTRHANDGHTTEDETTVLVFESGELVGRSRTYDWFGGADKRYTTVDFQAQQEATRQGIAALANGSSRQEILAALGDPDFVDYPADGMEVMSYRTRLVNHDSSTTRDETTALLLMDGGLTAVGDPIDILWPAVPVS